MNAGSAKIGFFMSIVSLVSFIIYILCFVAILLVCEPFVWTNINGLSFHEANNPVIYKYLGMVCMIIFSCVFVVMVACMFPAKKESKSCVFFVALSFSVAFCICISINYFVQISATRLQLLTGFTAGLEQFTQSFSISAINAINMLGWTLFYSIATFALSFLFDATSLGRKAKFFCLANSAMMLLGMVGYIINSYPILLVTMNMGLGVTSMGVIVTMGLFFRKTVYLKE